MSWRPPQPRDHLHQKEALYNQPRLKLPEKTASSVNVKSGLKTSSEESLAICKTTLELKKKMTRYFHLVFSPCHHRDHDHHEDIGKG